VEAYLAVSSDEEEDDGQDHEIGNSDDVA